MSETPWQGDAVSLVEEFRAGRRSPKEEMQATLGAVAKSSLNAISFVDTDGALERASKADISLPFGGVPLGIKELDPVKGWPDTEASVPLSDRIATKTSIHVERITQQGGAVAFGLTTASEFGGVNLTRTVLNGATKNPWNDSRTPGGSSGGSAAGVAGGLFTLATAGDGGGSIRIPAGFTGLVGLKSTYGRIPRGPGAAYGNLNMGAGYALYVAAADAARTVEVARAAGVFRMAPERHGGGRQHVAGRGRGRGRHPGILPGLPAALACSASGAGCAPGAEPKPAAG